MKTVQFISALILSIIILSCSEEDCVCTEQFAIISVLVIDNMSNPVDNLITEIRDEEGKLYDMSNEVLPLPGYYTVMTDNFVNEFSTAPKKILFIGQLDSLQVNGEFLINTDDCKCHINKVSGPDTLVLK